MKSKFTEMASIREMLKRSSKVAILINNCFSSSGSYSNFCLKLLSIQVFLDSLMISHFFYMSEASSSEGEEAREIEFDMSFDK